MNVLYSRNAIVAGAGLIENPNRSINLFLTRDSLEVPRPSNGDKPDTPWAKGERADVETGAHHEFVK